ncbi:MAG: hypothetical protein ACK4TP_05770 [Hyphomicrobium sp.]|jgi:hypothetical protein
MRRLRIGYAVIVALSCILNGWALLQHLSILPAHDGFIAAVLILNILATPLVVWASFVFGEVAMGPHRRRGLT